MEEKQYTLYDVDLAQLPLLRNVPLELVEVIKQEGMVRFYRDEETILHQGDEADGLVILLHGQVRILTDGVFLVSRRAYEVIGEQAFLNHAMRSATVIAQGTVKALVLPTSLVQHLLTDATFTGNLLRFVSQKLSEATNERASRFRNERLLFSEFSAHLAPEITQRLLATGLTYGQPRYIDGILLFADIRSFTERSAGMVPEQMAQQLSTYFDAMVTVIHHHEGFVDKFIGDAVMAVWGLAPSTRDSVIQALTCAKAMIDTAAQLAFGDRPISIGIGLNAGQVFIGNVGGEGKRQFTVLGTPVNLAARYESEAKALHVPLVMGKAFYDRLPPEYQEPLVMHENWPIKGVEPQILYSYTPVKETGRKEER